MPNYTIRTKSAVLTTADTLGEALAWANAHPATKGAAILWGTKGSTMNLREWALIRNAAVARLTARGLDTTALLANRGDR